MTISFEFGTAVARRLEQALAAHVDLNTVKPQFNQPLFDEILSITNNTFCPSNSKIYGKKPRHDETLL